MRNRTFLRYAKTPSCTYPHPDGTSLWGPLVFLLVFSPLPLGALHISAKFIRRAMRDERR